MPRDTDPRDVPLTDERLQQLAARDADQHAVTGDRRGQIAKALLELFIRRQQARLAIEAAKAEPKAETARPQQVYVEADLRKREDFARDLEALAGNLKAPPPDPPRVQPVRHATDTDAARRPEEEQVDGPAHYGGKDSEYEAIKVIEAWGLDGDFCLGNVVAYIARAGKKTADPLIDLRKALWYLDRKIQKLLADRGRTTAGPTQPRQE